MRILLVSLNRVADPYPVFPLGMAYVADALRAERHKVAVFDLLYRTEEDLVAEAKASKPDIVALSLRNIDNVRAD